MATLVFGMNQSLDGYVDHTAFGPGPALFHHFIEQAESQAGCVYGRRMYEVMRYWDDDQPDWGAEERAYAAAWRKLPKWVVSRSLGSVGPNATLVPDDVERVITDLKATRDGEIEVAGPTLAHSLSQLGLVDAFHIYLHPKLATRPLLILQGLDPQRQVGSVDRILGQHPVLERTAVDLHAA